MRDLLSLEEGVVLPHRYLPMEGDKYRLDRVVEFPQGRLLSQVGHRGSVVSLTTNRCVSGLCVYVSGVLTPCGTASGRLYCAGT